MYLSVTNLLYLLSVWSQNCISNIYSHGTVWVIRWINFSSEFSSLISNSASEFVCMRMLEASICSRWVLKLFCPILWPVHWLSQSFWLYGLKLLHTFFYMYFFYVFNYCRLIKTKFYSWTILVLSFSTTVAWLTLNNVAFLRDNSSADLSVFLGGVQSWACLDPWRCYCT